jgi:ribonuclease R
MSDKVGQTFDGVISGVTEWGIYVEIVENKCEGMIRNRDLKGDTYSFDEENYRYVGRSSGKVYALGDPVKIVVVSADLIKKQLNFAFEDDGVIHMSTEVTGRSKAGPGKRRSGGDNSKHRSGGDSKKKRRR